MVDAYCIEVPPIGTLGPEGGGKVGARVTANGGTTVGSPDFLRGFARMTAANATMVATTEITSAVMKMESIDESAPSSVGTALPPYQLMQYAAIRRAAASMK